MTDTVTLGLTCNVKFPTFKNAEIEAKVDTGATTSSIHAINITVANNMVSFMSPSLSPNVIRLPSAGTQEVHTADAGGNARCLVKLDVDIAGQVMKDVEFNLNDRSNMDTEVLIGENVLSSGLFQIDPTAQDTPTQDAIPTNLSEMQLVDAVRLILNSNLSWAELIARAQST